MVVPTSRPSSQPGSRRQGSSIRSTGRPQAAAASQDFRFQRSDRQQCRRLVGRRWSRQSRDDQPAHRDEQLPSTSRSLRRPASTPDGRVGHGVQHPDERDADQGLWNLTNALMHSWIDGDVPGSVDVGPPTDEDGDAWALGSLRGEDTDLQAPGRWGTVEVLELLGLFGLLGLLAAGLAVVVARQTE